MSRPRFAVWNKQECHRVHEATLSVLGEVGVEVNHERALALLASSGADVVGTRVRMGRELVERALGSAPDSWIVKSRGGDRTIELSQDSGSYYGTGPDCLYVRDASSGERRRALLADVQAMAALAEKLPHIDFVMSMALPCDVPADVADLAQFAAMLAGTRKPIVISSPNDGGHLRVMHHMAGICGEAESLACLTMPSPPLKHDHEAVDKALVCAELSIPLILAPAPACGSTCPSSVAASVIVGNAEVLSGLVVHQLVRPGASFVYGAGVGVMNMRTALDVYSAPECFLGNHAMCDLARYYNLPSWSYAGVSDAKSLDQQWAAEAALTTILGSLSRATLLHDVGYLESGMQSSFEAMILGDELVSYAQAFMKGAAIDAEALALEEIVAVGPGGNHLGRPYTRAHHQEFWRPLLLDQTVHDRWCAEGGLTLGERLRTRAHELLSEPEECVLDDATLAKVNAASGHLGRTAHVGSPRVPASPSALH
jgi:trimethylamine--corrinoid protein Co-methyltransferase